MPGIASNRVTPPLYQRQVPTRPRSEAKRTRIIEAATQHFAQHGYHAARVGDIAIELGIAKGSIFQHFGSKDGLFFEVYKRSVRSFAKYLDAPAEIRAAGFFEVLRYWLVRTEHLVHEDWIPYRISLLGNYGTDLVLKREINRFLISEDPYGTVNFVRFGLERHELRTGHGHRDDRFDHRLDGRALPGCTPYGGTRSRAVSPSRGTGRKEGSQNPAISGCDTGGPLAQ